MPTVVSSVTQYPTIQTITNLVRSMVRDDMRGATGTVGEGQILVDNQTTSVTMANFFNSALRELCRQLRLENAPMLIGDNYILTGLPPINGPMGLSVADPAVQVCVSANGYYDGTQWHGAFLLPSTCYQVVRVWERETDSQAPFVDLGEPANGLPGAYQTTGFGCWEWRSDAVWLPGSLDTRDLRLRYLMTLSAQMVASVNPASTYIPILGCEESVAAKISVLYAARQGGELYSMARQMESKATFDFLNEQVHRKQGTDYPTLAYGSECPPVSNWGM